MSPPNRSPLPTLSTVTINVCIKRNSKKYAAFTFFCSKINKIISTLRSVKNMALAKLIIKTGKGQRGKKGGGVVIASVQRHKIRIQLISECDD